MRTAPISILVENPPSLCRSPILNVRIACCSLAIEWRIDDLEDWSEDDFDFECRFCSFSMPGREMVNVISQSLTAWKREQTLTTRYQ